MPIGTFTYTCFCCGASGTCGDCISIYCPKCDKKIRQCHNGQIPDMFGDAVEEPHEDCPCSQCKHARNERSIQKKLTAAGIRL